MKRTKLLALTLIMITLIVPFALSGCNFRASEIVYTSDGRANSVLLSSDVDIQTSDQTASDIVTAVERTEKTAVAIQMADESSWGSGVIVDIKKYDGATLLSEPNVYYVITCYHVISGGGRIIVYSPDNEGDNFTDDAYDESYAFSGTITAVKDNTSSVSLVGGDSVSDIAVLRIRTSKTLSKATVPSETYQTRKGENVYAIGNPSGERANCCLLGKSYFRVATCLTVKIRVSGSLAHS